MNIGAQIKKIRKANNTSRRILADELNISQQQLYKYETNKNKTPLHFLVPIAKYFGVSLEYFIDEEASVKNHQSLTLQEKEILNIFSTLSTPKQKLLLNIARQFITKKKEI